MREVVLDTETTGLNPDRGDRIVEIGAIELINHLPTGKTFHSYLNPMIQSEMPEESFKVHGLSTDFLSNKPLFSEIAENFVNFHSTCGQIARVSIKLLKKSESRHQPHRKLLA